MNKNQGNQDSVGKAKGTVTNVVKSPSDTTLYTPALKRIKPIATVAIGNLNNTGHDAQMIDRISNFVESIRMSNESKEQGKQQPGTSSYSPVTRVNVNRGDQQEFETVQWDAEKAMIEAEKYRAVIAEPPGEQNNQFISTTAVGSGLTDDDFFYLTCHIDSNLIAKIEKGEYVDLDKLLVKDSRKKNGDNNKLE